VAVWKEIFGEDTRFAVTGDIAEALATASKENPDGGVDALITGSVALVGEALAELK
jgi:folylpolyglutamate synthase/dihydropteroate synthase